jgi:hypothetical protein
LDLEDSQYEDQIFGQAIRSMNIALLTGAGEIFNA